MVADRAGRVLDDPVITEIAKEHDKSPAQVVLRWHIQLGNIVFPKSVTASPGEGELRDLRLRADAGRRRVHLRAEQGRAHRPRPGRLQHDPQVVPLDRGPWAYLAAACRVCTGATCVPVVGRSLLVMPVLLVVHHTTSPVLADLLDAVLKGTRAEGISGVDVQVRPALAATAVDVLAADAFLLGTPANIGYMSGALKHFFDQIYYPTLTAKVGAPYGVYVHGNNDITGALRGIQTIAKGLGWSQAHQPIEVVGAPSKDDLENCWDLGATLAAGLMA